MLFKEELIKVLNEQIEIVKDHLTNKGTHPELADIRFDQGRITALRSVLETLDEVETRLNNR
jgi:hypothetical protein